MCSSTERLIETIRPFECLYNSSIKSYHDRVCKNNARIYRLGTSWRLDGESVGPAMNNSIDTIGILKA